MTFKEKLQHKYALSEQGAKDMIHAFISATISNIVLMFPVGMLYLLVKNYMEGTLKEKGILFAAGCLICLILIGVTTYIQYNATFLSTYVESGVRRITLAEKLRKINKKFSVKLSATRFTYNGKVQKPKVTVKVGTKTLSSKYYTVTYRNNKNTGYATVLVQGKGSYANYAAKISFVIIPKQMKTPSVKSTAKKKMTVSWTRDSQATQYIIQYSQNKNFTGKTTKTVTISKNTIKARTFTGLTSNKNYYVRIRSVKVVNDKKLYSSWSKTSRVKVK